MKVTFACKIIADLPSEKETSISEILNMLHDNKLSIDWAYCLDSTGEPTLIITEKEATK